MLKIHKTIHIKLTTKDKYIYNVQNIKIKIYIILALYKMKYQTA